MKPPLIIAHRGASALVAEHTLQAYVAALEAGADGLECDVRLTRDGELVCVHDRTVNRTSSGTGVVSEFTLPELDALDFSSWHPAAPGVPDPADPADPADTLAEDETPERAGTGVLRLSMLLELVRDAGRPVRLLIETKHPTRWAGLVEKELVALLTRFGWAGRPGPGELRGRRPAPEALPVAVMSFAPTALRRMRLLAPDVPTVLLLERLSPVRREWLMPSWARAAGPGIVALKADPGFVERVHRRHREVFVWTVDEPADVAFAVELGVDALITNRPAEVIAQIR